MKLTYLASATVIVEVGSCRILMDPWLTDGEYYGAWAQYPAFDWRGWSFDDIDFIYVSHIHPDHVSAETMRRLPKSIPVLIHSYEAKFLRRSIEAIGFEVRELPHNRRVPLKGSAHINILAADDCNPELCGRFYGCAKFEVRLGSTQIDSLCVIDDGRHVLVNVNDCPNELSRHLLPKIKSAYGHVDMLLVGYSGAGPYPQCFGNLTEAQKIAGATAKKRKFLEQAVSYIHDLAPRYYLPFAGQYTLCGRLSQLDDYRGVPELDEAAAYLSVAAPGSRCVLLNCGATFDVASSHLSTDYVPIDTIRKRAYRDEVLVKRALAYDGDDVPGQAELETLIRSAFGRLSAKRREVGFESDTAVYVDLASDHLARVAMKNEELSIVRTPLEERHVRITADPKLLRRLLSGPRLAHWNNAEIGSHLRYERRPDVYERGLYYTMCFFHA